MECLSGEVDRARNDHLAFGFLQEWTRVRISEYQREPHNLPIPGSSRDPHPYRLFERQR